MICHSAAHDQALDILLPQVRDIPGLPKALYEVAEREFALTTSTVVKSSASKDGSTTKLLVKLQVRVSRVLFA